MSLLDSDLLKSNCAGDEDMMREMISMGLQSLGETLTGIDTALQAEDWNNLARFLHKIRPILCYCGITSLTDELQEIEINAKQGNELPALKNRINKIITSLEQAQSEMQMQMSLLSK